MNTFGQLLRLTDFGESHGKAIGGVLDGLPAGLHVNLNSVQEALDRRRPGSSPQVSARREPDKVQWLSGLTDEGVTIGSPIAFLIPNTDAHPDDYKDMEGICRPGHADFTWRMKYGVPLPTGGGYASARRTAACVVAGELAQQFLRTHNIEVRAFLSSMGPYNLKNPLKLFPEKEDIYASSVRCPDVTTSHTMQEYLEHIKKQHDSIGGAVSFIAMGVPIGLGEPPYGKLSTRLAEAMMSINAVKGVMIGDVTSPEHLAGTTGSAYVDQWTVAGGTAYHSTNHAGGIEGGISNGEQILLTVGFKPTPTIGRPLQALTDDFTLSPLYAKGRHDPCVAIRGVSVVEAMGSLVLADAVLLKAAYK